MSDVEKALRSKSPSLVEQHNNDRALSLRNLWSVIIAYFGLTFAYERLIVTLFCVSSHLTKVPNSESNYNFHRFGSEILLQEKEIIELHIPCCMGQKILNLISKEFCE